MEERTLKIISNYLNTNIYSYLETSGGQRSNLHLNVVHFFNTGVNGTVCFKNCKQLFEYQHLLLLKDTWWSKF